MARNKEGLILLIDVGPSMHNVLPEVEKVCTLLIEKKLIYHKFDEVGVVLFGTKETENELTREVGGYQHVMVLRNIKVVDSDVVESLQQLPRGTADGDFLDAIIVAMDMLIKKYQETNKGRKRICFITNAQCPIKDPFEGMKEDQVTTIAKQMTVHGMKMESIIIRGGLCGNADKEITGENDLLLNIFSTATSARLVYVENPISLHGAMRTRNIAPVTVFRGDIEISSKMRIKVRVYKKTAEEKFPTLKKYSDKAPLSDKSATHEIKVDYEYKSVEDQGKIVPPDQRIRGYRYGPQVVPISSAEWDAVKFKPEKGVKLLGFTDSSNIFRHHYMKDVYIFVAEPGNTGAMLSVSALARAMKEMNKVAILRCVWRQGQNNVVVGVLTPNVSVKDTVPDSFFFNVLPFTEDVREFQFPSFDNFPASLLPNEQEQEAADNLVQMLDLAPPEKVEALQPDITPNPILERFYRHLEFKAKDPDAVVAPLDETLKKITEPDANLLSQNKSIIETFSRTFELKENPSLKKKRRLLREKPSESSDEEDHKEISVQQAILNENTSIVKAEVAGNMTPVRDFKATMSRRDGPEWVAKAIQDMKTKIHNLVEDSHEGDNYPKVFECLAALRKGCIIEQEPKEFNDFLHRLCKFGSEKHLNGFSEYLASRNLTLISKTEATDSDVAEDEVRSFLVKSEAKVE